MAKSKERLDAEATHQMTSKQKLSNFWFYYRWWLMGGSFALVMTAVFIHDIRSNVKPDYTIGVLTRYTMQEATLGEMEAAILPYIDDRNGDGKTVVTLSSYNLAVGDAPIGDPMAHAAAMTRLSGDIQMGESMLFITDDIESYQQNLDLFCYNDGTDPPLEGEPDYTLMGVPLSDCPALAKVDTSKVSPGSFVLVKRAVAPELLERKEELNSYHKDSIKLFEALTSK